MRYFIELSYNGKEYHGWQIQPNATSVQEVLEKALSTILRETIQVVGAGRTDAGVHAAQIFAHFDVERNFDQDKLVYKLNALLPKDIAIQKIFRVKDDAHARFHAVKRSYEYKIVTRKNPFQYEFAHCVKLPLDVEKMNEAAKVLLAYNDFQCFSKVKTDVFTYNCDIYRADWEWRDNTLIFTISADRFLRNMVRAIVGTLIEIGLGKMEIESMHKIINSKNRAEAGASVPGHALYLTEVKYPDTIFYGR